MTEALVAKSTIADLARRASGVGEEGGDDRLKAITERLLRDLFQTMVDFEVTPDEAWAAIGYVGSVGLEAGLLAPGLGIEHFIDIMQDAHDARAGLTGGTPRTIEGPLYVAGAPLSSGSARLDDGSDTVSEKLIVTGTVRDLEGAPIPGAIVDVWHANRLGFYSHFDPSQPAYHLRRRIETDAQGRYKARTIMPVGYGCPPDGPTAQLLNRLGRHSQRPSHVHFFVSAPGYRQLTTQFNIAGDPLTYDDFAFATRDDLVAEARDVTDRQAIADEGLDGPFKRIDFDFSLQRNKAGAPSSLVHRARMEA